MRSRQKFVKPSVAYALLYLVGGGGKMRSRKQGGKNVRMRKLQKGKKNSVAGTRTRVSRVRAEYPNQLDYNGCVLGISYHVEIIHTYIVQTVYK